MFGSEILEVAIGLAFVYLLVSLICSAVREGIEARLKTRAAYLERGIRELLHDPDAKGLARQLYEHPLIYGLYADGYLPKGRKQLSATLARGGTLPSYIPASNFATALMDMAVRGTDPIVGADSRSPILSIPSLRSGIVNIENEAVQRVLLTAVDTARGDLDRARENIQAWFDSGMDRVSGWYKRSTQLIIFWIALGVVVTLNVNTITVVDYLFRHDDARARIVARAEAAVADSTFLDAGYGAARAALDSLGLGPVGLPIGWSRGWGAPRPGVFDTGDPWNSLFAPFLGWMMTAFAAALGAPFWFDLLNKVMVIRATVKPREKSPEEGSEDRRPQMTPPPIPASTLLVSPPAGPAGSEVGMSSASIVDAVSDDEECRIPVLRATRDDELPPAEGGVA